MIDKLLQNTHKHINKSMDSTHQKFQSIHTGRTNPTLLNHININYYNTITPLHQLSTISTPKTQMLTIQPYNKNSIKTIKQTIIKSNLNLTPNNNNSLIHLILPKLTKKQHKQLIKIIHKLTKKNKITLHNIHHNIIHNLKKLHNTNKTNTNNKHHTKKTLQKLTNNKIKKLNTLLKNKKTKILKI